MLARFRFSFISEFDRLFEMCCLLRQMVLAGFVLIEAKFTAASLNVERGFTLDVITKSDIA